MNLVLHSYGSSGALSYDIGGKLGSSSDVREFLRELKGTEIERIVVPCVPKNAQTICRIADEYADRLPCCRWAFGFRDDVSPEEAFTTLKSNAMPIRYARLGIKEVIAARCSEYVALLTPMKNDPPDVVEAQPRVWGWFAEHPAWPLLAIAAGDQVNNPFCRLSYAKVLAMVLDPRRFLHPFKPERLSKLFQYFCASPAAFKALSEEKVKWSPAHKLLRARALTDVWAKRADAGPPDLHNPSSFLWRAAVSSPASDETYRMMAKGSRKFLTLLYHFWSASLANHPEVSFAAERFFRTPEEKNWFEKTIGQPGV